MQVKPGIHSEFTDEEYFSIPALNNSSLWQLNKSAAHFELSQKPQSSKKDKELNFGTALHIALLKPKQFQNRVHVLSRKYDMRKNKDKLDFEIEMSGIDPEVLISKEEKEEIDIIINNIYDHELARAIFNCTQTETTLIWNDEYFPILKKAKCDGLKINDNSVILWDIKSIHDISKISKHTEEYGYANQLVHYMDGIRVLYNVKHCNGLLLFICKQTLKPKIEILSSEYLKAAEIRYRQLLEKYMILQKSKEYNLQEDTSKPGVLKCPRNLLPLLKLQQESQQN